MTSTPIVIHAQVLNLHHAPVSELPPIEKLSIAPSDAGDFAPTGGAVSGEYRILGKGKALSLEQVTAELEELGEGWRLETPHELFALVDYSRKNGHGAYTGDPTLRAGYYWTSQETPWFEGGRVVVGFAFGVVLSAYDNLRAFARAVRVSSQ